MPDGSSVLAGQASTGDFDRVLVVDLGAQYAQLIARRVREAHVLSEIVPRDITVEQIKARNPVGIILSGGPASVYSEGAYEIDAAIFETGIPVLGICYGHQLLAHSLGGASRRRGRPSTGRPRSRLSAIRYCSRACRATRRCG